jgi:methyltransferase (TIGR00027 family)
LQSGQPSRTALAAATHRAVHQIVEHGWIFSDPLAVPILGRDADSIAREAEEDPAKRRMRIFIAVRTRFAEDALAAALDRGVRQVVVLGAGLDTYAYRRPIRENVRVFEVDHPATQIWKRERLAAAAITPPAALTFAPIDFERETLPGGLAAAGFDINQQTFFTWLGVVPYLTENAIWSTLEFIASLRNGAHVVFDYADPSETFSPEARLLHDQRAARVEALGEKWLSYFDPVALHARLAALGLKEIEDLGPPQIAARYFPGRVTPAPDRGGHILRATTV